MDEYNENRKDFALEKPILDHVNIGWVEVGTSVVVDSIDEGIVALEEFVGKGLELSESRVVEGE